MMRFSLRFRFGPMMSSILLLMVLSLIAPIEGLHAQTDDDAIARVDEAMNNITDAGVFSGALLIGRAGEILLSKGYGMANLEWDIPNTPQTKFRIASITKQFTGMAILMLQEQGKLTVEDKLCQYIEECPAEWKDVTLFHLLTHTSGIPDYVGKRGSVGPTTVYNLIQDFIDKPLIFQPATSWNYTNSAYILLGYVIEQISDQSYQAFLNDNIFEPLGMLNTGYDRYDQVIKNRAEGYSSSTRKAHYIDMSTPYAAGALYSTVEDLYLWEQALHSGKVVSQESLDTMSELAVTLPDTVDVKYGYGLVMDKIADHRYIGHAGGINGFTSFTAQLPDDDVTIVALSNLETADALYISEIALRKFFGED